MSVIATFRPSGAPMWGVCSAYPTVARSTFSREHERTRLGTGAHDLAARCLNVWTRREQGSDNPRDYLGQTMSNGVIVDEEIVQGVEQYVDNVTDCVAAWEFGRSTLLVEHRLYMPRIHEQCWGTTDAATRIGDTIYVWDYKHGHRKPDAFLQAVCYVEGLREFYRLTAQDVKRTNVVIRFCHPFAYSAGSTVTEWRGKLTDLEPFVLQLAEKAREATLSPSLTAGTHCKDCEGRLSCSAYLESCANYLEVAGQPMAFDAMTVRSMAVLREQMKRGQTLIGSLLDALEDEITHAVKQGDTSTNLTLESVQGREKWKGEPEEVIAALALMGLDARRPHCDTPAQARAKMPAKQRKAFSEAIKPLTTHNSALKLVERENTIGAKVFGDKKQCHS